MERFRLASALILMIGLLVGASAQPTAVSVTVNVTLGGQPTDALVMARQNGEIVNWRYTDVHTPGMARLNLAPGNYGLRVDHGVGFTSTPKTVDLTVKAGSAAEISVSLSRALDPTKRGYYGIDLHAHTAASAPAMERDFGISNHGMTPVDQAVGVQLAADLDAAFISDHNSVGGHSTFADTAEARGMPYLLSEEITTLRWGHFNVYSLRPSEPVQFAFGKAPSAYFQEAGDAGASMVQVNHPLWSNGGYWFNRAKDGYNPNFDAAEAFNGRFGDDDAETIRQLFRFWNEGRGYVATAASDDHDWNDDVRGVDRRYGTPRTYVHAGDEPSAEAILTSLKQGHAFLTYGPMLYLRSSSGAIPGDTVQATDALTLQARVESVTSLDGLRAEWIADGERVAQSNLNGTSQQLVSNIDLSGANWALIRLVDESGRVRAMTNPIWLEPSS
ncbi:MAG: CehA/McbA family metallohydrolase [Candidatus Bipolaricaulia bacterium]